MKYHNLQELLQNSRSSRTFFVSLPVELQCRLHEQSPYIRSAAELHAGVNALKALDRLSCLGKWNPKRDPV